MSSYLVVARQTASSDALIEALRDIVERDRKAGFTLLVPATRVPRLLTWTEGEAISAAKEAADAARGRLGRAGLRVTATFVGDESPIQAIADVLQGGDRYKAIVISTLPPGASRWLKMDVQAGARRQFGLPVISVIATRAPAASTA